MANKTKIIFITLFMVVSFFCFVKTTSAFVPSNNPGPDIGLEYGGGSGLGSEDIRFTIANIISAALGMLGIVTVVLIIYAGFKWTTAGGNDENVASAKKILTAAVIGLAIVFSAYSITRFVMINVYKSTTGMIYYEGFYGN